MIDRLAWFGLGACVGGVAMALLMSEEEKKEEQPKDYLPRPPEPGRFRPPQDRKRKPGLTISIDPRKKTDQPLVKLEWEKKNK